MENSLNVQYDIYGGCPTCGGKIKIPTSEFIEKCKLVHDDLYDYSKTIYLGAAKQIEVICKKHGSFSVTATHHLNRKSGCPTCSVERQRSCTSEFISKAKMVHGDVYDYSKVNYIKNSVKVVITCPHSWRLLPSSKPSLEWSRM